MLPITQGSKHMEAVFQQFQAVLNSGYAITTALAGLIAVLIKLLARVLDLHDRHIVQKDFERLRKLRECTPEGTSLASYLDETIQTESFRIASGISTSSLKMAYLLQLSSLGRWDRNQIRALSSYVRLPPDAITPTIYLSRLSFYDGLFCLLGGFYLIFVGLFFLLYMGLMLPSLLGWFAGSAVCLTFFICALGLWKGFANYHTAKHIKKYLDYNKADLPALAASAPIV
jgi:hypothetical protein